MQAHVLRGTKQQIAENLAQMPGEVREAIVFVEEPAQAEARMPAGEDIFAEMRPYMVTVEDLDDTREAVYTRGEGELGHLRNCALSASRNRSASIQYGEDDVSGRRAFRAKGARSFSPGQRPGTRGPKSSTP
ncbi:MAG TPA: hypothetical protein VLV54_13295 [Thermoanaerobaculia bacterium]|nr:hypothetical protein [Thermoanaerobaculia bacterium]